LSIICISDTVNRIQLKRASFKQIAMDVSKPEATFAFSIKYKPILTLHSSTF